MLVSLKQTLCPVELSSTVPPESLSVCSAEGSQLFPPQAAHSVDTDGAHLLLATVLLVCMPNVNTLYLHVSPDSNAVSSTVYNQ